MRGQGLSAALTADGPAIFLSHYKSITCERIPSRNGAVLGQLPGFIGLAARH
jgi:hypothetical protein